MRRTLVCCAAFVALVATGCTPVRPWEREILARPEMAWDPDPLEATLRSHIFYSKEASLPGAARLESRSSST